MTSGRWEFFSKCRENVSTWDSQVVYGRFPGILKQFLKKLQSCDVVDDDDLMTDIKYDHLSYNNNKTEPIIGYYAARNKFYVRLSQSRATIKTNQWSWLSIAYLLKQDRRKHLDNILHDEYHNKIFKPRYDFVFFFLGLDIKCFSQFGKIGNRHFVHCYLLYNMMLWIIFWEKVTLIQ